MSRDLLSESTPIHGSQHASRSIIRNSGNRWYKLAQLSSLIFLITSYYVIWKGGYSFFKWHPTLELAFFFFATQAVLAIQYSPTQVQGIDKHQLYHIFSIASLIGASSIILIYKISENESHFGSPHSKLGLLINLLALTAAFFGSATIHFPSLLMKDSIVQKAVAIHRILGYTTILLVVTNIYLGLEMAFSVSKTGYAYLIYPSLVLALGSILASSRPSSLLRRRI